MMWILGVTGVFLAIFTICVVVRIIKKVTTPTTLDEELAEYEALLREREKRGIGVDSTNPTAEKVAIPIIAPNEVNELLASSVWIALGLSFVELIIIFFNYINFIV